MNVALIFSASPDFDLFVMLRLLVDDLQLASVVAIDILKIRDGTHELIFILFFKLLALNLSKAGASVLLQVPANRLVDLECVVMRAVVVGRVGIVANLRPLPGLDVPVDDLLGNSHIHWRVRVSGHT